MPTITIDGRELPFEKGQTILQVALDHEIEIPHYCYPPGTLDPRQLPHLPRGGVGAQSAQRQQARADPEAAAHLPDAVPVRARSCYTDSPKAVANQKAVMEYLLINHPVDCPVCDQAGECHLQDYSYQYGRGEARFQEQKIKQPKKDVGPHVLLYSDRCIMCTRCVRFTREVTGTGELMVDGRGAMEQIDVFPGLALDNELSGNVVDLCPVGALLDKDFLFQQRVWFLKQTASIDGVTASGDNVFVEHHDGVVYRLKPRTNLDVNKWWITDEVRYGWKFVHADHRITMPRVKGEDPFADVEAPDAYEAAYGIAMEAIAAADRVGLMASPMLSCEDAYLLARAVTGRAKSATLGVGPVPVEGEDKVFPDGYRMYAEKAPNARGVRRSLRAFATDVHDADDFVRQIDGCDVVVLTGNYPSAWATDAMMSALESVRTVILIDTLESRLAERADIVLPGATWMEKSGSFVNAHDRLQAFDRAIEPIDFAKSEAQIALDLEAWATGGEPETFAAAATRAAMAADHELTAFVDELHETPAPVRVESDMKLVEI